MFALRAVVFGALDRGMRSGPGLVLAGIQAGTSLLGVSRTCSTAKSGGPSQLDDLPPTMFKKDYLEINAEGVNDVVKRLLSLDMASQADKLMVKTQQLVDKVKRSPDDTKSIEVRIATLTARIQNLQEHLQIHTKDKANKRNMLLSVDRRKKLLKLLRHTHYDSFEHVCTELGIEYTFPQEYYRPATKRWIAKKAFSLQVYRETQELKETERSKQKPKRFPKVHAPLYVFPQQTD